MNVKETCNLFDRYKKIRSDASKIAFEKLQENGLSKYNYIVDNVVTTETGLLFLFCKKDGGKDGFGVEVSFDSLEELWFQKKKKF